MEDISGILTGAVKSRAYEYDKTDSERGNRRHRRNKKRCQGKQERHKQHRGHGKKGFGANRKEARQDRGICIQHRDKFRKTKRAVVSRNGVRHILI